MSTDYAQRLVDISAKQDLTIIVNDKPVLLPVRVPMQGEYVVIDAINYVTSVSAFDSFEAISLNTTNKDIMQLDLNDEQYSYMINLITEQIQIHLVTVFGADYIMQPMTAGIHHYKFGYYIKSPLGETLGTVGVGGQNNTVFIGITGMGCKLAENGYEHRLHDFLARSPDARITRIDLAHDDLTGDYSSFDICNQKESENAFVLPKARTRPAVVIHGEFKHGDPLGKGLTMNVGSRKNGKVFRGYEKGKQLGDTESLWFRGELEMHNKQRLIPFDVLLHPTEYFCGAYPYTWELIELAKKHKGDNAPQSADKMPSIKQEAEISTHKAISVLRHQFGKYIKTFGELYTKKDEQGNTVPDYKAIFEKIVTQKKSDYYPKRLKLVVKTFNQEILPQEKIAKNNNHIHYPVLSALELEFKINKAKNQYRHSGVNYYDETNCPFVRC